jgi:putative endonuclease
MPAGSTSAASSRRAGMKAVDVSDRDARTTRRRDGDEAEAYARRYLECAGLSFVAANVLYRDGEIDLVMRDARPQWASPPIFVFVEVRRRSRDAHGGAAGSITREKRRRIAAAAAHYLVGLGLRTLPTCRFDVVAVDGDPANGFHVDWIRDAFQDEGQ